MGAQRKESSVTAGEVLCGKSVTLECGRMGTKGREL